MLCIQTNPSHLFPAFHRRRHGISDTGVGMDDHVPTNLQVDEISRDWPRGGDRIDRQMRRYPSVMGSAVPIQFGATDMAPFTMPRPLRP